jgi:hypothetical protein
LLSLWAQAAWGQVLVVDAAGQQPGRYYVEVTIAADGRISAKVIQDVFRMTAAPIPPDGPVVPPVDPGQLHTDLARAANEAVVKVNSPGKASERMQLGVLYSELQKLIGVKIQGPPWQELANVTTKARAELLGQADAAWQPWVSAVAAELSKLEKMAGEAGLQADQVRSMYGQICLGLEYNDGKESALSPEMRELIRKIVLMILQELLAGAAS